MSNRNTELHFGHIPEINMERSKFDESFSHTTTFNAGEIIPFYADEILPGDTVEMDMAEVIRMSTPIHPVMGNAVCDIYYFFVPDRLLWEHWEEFWGYNPDTWIQETEYEIPYIESPEGGWAKKTIADYMGVPTYVDGQEINAFFFRAYAKVFSDWFRSEAVQSEAHLYRDDTNRTGSNGDNYITDIELGGKPAKACKLMDYFTGGLPSPQRGPNVTIPLGSTAPVRTDATSELTAAGMAPMYFSDAQGSKVTGSFITGTYNGQLEAYTNVSGTPVDYIVPRNLVTDLGDATAATISALRQAFAVQRYFEQIARSGTRYIEICKALYGVTSSDARMQRSEYIGGTRFPINMDQVIQMSSTDATTPQGNTAGFSCTVQNDSMFTKSFEEHGILLGCLVVRTEKTYQQGLHRKFSRRKKFDIYNPFFAHLSEQGILNKEIYSQGKNVVDASGEIIDDQIFAYQEAWAEYRYKQNRVSGEMRSNTPGGGLDSWHYADDYTELPKLSAEWIVEDGQNIDRTLAVSQELAPQFIADLYFDVQYTRCMPVYSFPGLIDHV